MTAAGSGERLMKLVSRSEWGRALDERGEVSPSPRSGVTSTCATSEQALHHSHGMVLDAYQRTSRA
jgi:hypothetical protein